MKSISIDIETFSDVDLGKCGVYKYAESPTFEILLFGYAVDSGEVQVVDLAQGEQFPDENLDALTDDDVTKWAFDANFERVCLSRYLRDRGISLDPFDIERWKIPLYGHAGSKKAISKTAANSIVKFCD